jgi:mono/diheme cytochrome c family protein
MRLLALIGALAIIVAVAAAVFFFGGFWSVAETEDDPGIVNWALASVRSASVARHATEAPPASLDDPATAEAGARVYATIGCVNCHGAPGVKWAKFSEGLKPVPADLVAIARARTPSELFWVIKSGVKFTGMPSFGLAGVSDQDIWRIVAFVRKLPTVTEADYKAWTASP